MASGLRLHVTAEHPISIEFGFEDHGDRNITFTRGLG